MSLNTRKHEAIHDKTGDDLARIKANFDNGKHLEVLDFGPEAAMIYQIQKMQEELDYLRTEIALNKAKTGITSQQASDITTNNAKTGITSSQASAITANTAKTSMTLGTTGSTALAGDTKLVGIGANTTISFGDMAESRGTYTITLTATRNFGRGDVTKSITLTLT